MIGVPSFVFLINKESGHILIDVLISIWKFFTSSSHQ